MIDYHQIRSQSRSSSARAIALSRLAKTGAKPGTLLDLELGAQRKILSVHMTDICHQLGAKRVTKNEVVAANTSQSFSQSPRR